MNQLPVLRLEYHEFKRLPEYSCSLPTGTTTGKRWKRHDGAHDYAFIARGGKPRWMIGEYGQPTPDGKSIAIHWYRPRIICRSTT